MLNMKKAEIVKMYKEAKNKREQITILADLNCTTRKEIEEVLMAAGIEIPSKKTAPKKPTNPNNTKSATTSKPKKEEVIEDDCVEEIEEIPEMEYPIETKEKIPPYVRSVLEEELTNLERRIKHLENTYREIADFLNS